MPTADSAAPLVTIIVTSHNYGRFLGEAIESALAQTYPSCEVLVIDDGSTDDSLEVASRYSEAARIISQPHMGLERTCNRAVREAQGEYIALLDADDVFEPSYVEELFRALRRSPDASYAYCRPRYFGARTGLMRCLPFSAYFMIKRTNFVKNSALMLRGDYLDVGGFSEELAEYALEDWDFWLKMLEHGKRGTYVRTPLLRWRRHEEGSRNPEVGAKLARSVAVIRGRHRDLYQRVSDRRGNLFYLLDLCLAALDLVLGLSRSRRFVQAFERSSWRRFQRWHAPGGGAHSRPPGRRHRPLH